MLSAGQATRNHEFDGIATPTAPGNPRPLNTGLLDVRVRSPEIIELGIDTNSCLDISDTDMATALTDDAFKTSGDRADRRKMSTLGYASTLRQSEPPVSPPVSDTHKVNHEMAHP